MSQNCWTQDLVMEASEIQDHHVVCSHFLGGRYSTQTSFLENGSMMVHCQTKSFTGSSLVKNGMVVAKIN
jgi:hypothetical protein